VRAAQAGATAPASATGRRSWTSPTRNPRASGHPGVLISGGLLVTRVSTVMASVVDEVQPLGRIGAAAQRRRRGGGGSQAAEQARQPCCCFSFHSCTACSRLRS
jgi:hypothetical protein